MPFRAMSKHHWMFKTYTKLSSLLSSYTQKKFLEAFNFFCDVKIKEA